MELLEKLDIRDLENLENWFERFNLYVLTNDKINEKNICAYYLTLIGKEAYHLLKDLCFPDAPKDKNPDALHKILLDHLKPQNFELLERAKFHSITRYDQENFNDFILRVQKSASSCNFGNQLKTQLRDRIVAGINNSDAQKKLLLEKNLTFDKAKLLLNDSVNIDKAVKDVSVLNNSTTNSVLATMPTHSTPKQKHTTTT